MLRDNEIKELNLEKEKLIKRVESLENEYKVKLKEDDIKIAEQEKQMEKMKGVLVKLREEIDKKEKNIQNLLGDLEKIKASVSQIEEDKKEEEFTVEKKSISINMRRESLNPEFKFLKITDSDQFKNQNEENIIDEKDNNININEPTMLLQSQEIIPSAPVEEELQNTPKGDRPKTVEISTNYQLDSKLYTSYPSQPSRPTDFTTVIPKMVETVDNTVRGTITSLPQISDGNMKEIMAELAYLRRENDILRREKTRNSNLLMKIWENDDNLFKKVKIEDSGSNIWQGLGENYEEEELDLEKLEEVTPQQEESLMVDFGNNLSNLLLRKYQEEKGNEISPEIEHKMKEYVSKSLALTFLPQQVSERRYKSVETKPVKIEFEPVLSTVKETKMEEYSQGIEEVEEPENKPPQKPQESIPKTQQVDSILLKENEEFNKELLDKFYKGFLDLVDDHPVYKLDTPRFDNSSSEKKRDLNNIKRKDIVEGDDPNKYSTPFTYSKSNITLNLGKKSNNTEGGLSSDEHVANLENIIGHLRNEISYFRQFFSADDAINRIPVVEEVDEKNEESDKDKSPGIQVKDVTGSFARL